MSGHRQFIMKVDWINVNLNKEKALEMTNQSDAGANIKLYKKQSKDCSISALWDRAQAKLYTLKNYNWMW